MYHSRKKGTKQQFKMSTPWKACAKRGLSLPPNDEVGGSYRESSAPHDTGTMIARVPTATLFLGRVAGRIVPQSGATALRPVPATVARQARSFTEGQLQTRSFFSKERSKSVYEYGAHRSDAEAKIAQVPVVMVDGPVALCDGGERSVASEIHGLSLFDHCIYICCCCRTRTLFPSTACDL